MEHWEFVVFALEAYRLAKGLTGEATIELFKRTKALEFIDECYDALHTYGDENIVWNIDEYINNHSDV